MFIMPIYLPPITRRRFLTQVAVAGAGLILRPSLRATERGEKDPCWIFLSDTHIAADTTAISRHENMAANLAAVVDQVLAWPRKPDGVIVNGDLAFKTGQAADYEAFLGLLRPLRETGVPVILSLGNHDDRATFRATVLGTEGDSSPLPDRHVMLVPTPRVNWFVLDSLNKTASSPGRLGEEQLAWLARELDANTEKPAMVIVHHHPDKGGDKIALTDTAELLEVIRPRRQVKAYIFGHTHVWNVAQDPSGLHLLNLPPTSYLFAPGPPIGWVSAIVKRDRLAVELHCLDHAHPQHGQALELPWRNSLVS